MQKFPGQGLNLSHSSDNTKYLTPRDSNILTFLRIVFVCDSGSNSLIWNNIFGAPTIYQELDELKQNACSQGTHTLVAETAMKLIMTLRIHLNDKCIS